MFFFPKSSLKRCIFASLFLSTMAFTSFAEGYRIVDIEYTTEGKTKAEALDRNLALNKHKVYNTKEDFETFISDLQNRLDSERIFKSATVEASYGEEDSEGVVGVTLHISTKDSSSFFLLPYPKYKSDDGKFPSGLTAKIKLKDYNFLGLMETLNIEVTGQISTEDDTTEHEFGLGVSYDYPFDVDPFQLTWENEFSIDYTIEESAPEFEFSTGLDIVLPFDVFSLDLDLKQSITRENDYEEYSDTVYMTESEEFSIPITVGEIENWGNVTYSPFVASEQYWDKDGISINNSDLRGIRVEFGHKISSSRIDWKGNFRSGASVAVTQSYTYNTYEKALTPYYSGDLEIFMASKYAGLAMRFYTFQYLQTYGNNNIVGTKITDELRGIRDQKFDEDYWEEGEESEVYQASPYALKTPAALIFNFDFPIKIFYLDWYAMRESIIENFLVPVLHTSHDPLIMKPFKLGLLKKLNFELQLSPFVDVGLLYNRATNKLYSLRDGFYSGGLEMLVYPKHWRSVIGRLSFGVDIGRKIFKNKLDLDTDWRRTSTATWELTIGLGLHY